MTGDRCGWWTLSRTPGVQCTQKIVFSNCSPFSPSSFVNIHLSSCLCRQLMTIVLKLPLPLFKKSSVFTFLRLSFSSSCLMLASVKRWLKSQSPACICPPTYAQLYFFSSSLIVLETVLCTDNRILAIKASGPSTHLHTPCSAFTRFCQLTYWLDACWRLIDHCDKWLCCSMKSIKSITTNN